MHGDGRLSAGKATALIGKNERYHLRIFLDKRVFEVYVNDGVAALYGTIDAAPHDLGVAASARGDGAALTAVKAWQLRPAEFDLSRFRA